MLLRLFHWLTNTAEGLGPALILLLFGAVGWYLKSRSIKAAAERAAVGRALTNLVLIRERVLKIRLVVEEMLNAGSTDRTKAPVLENSFALLVPEFPGLQEQYLEALKILSGRWPLFTADLYKHNLFHNLTLLREFTTAEPRTLEVLPSIVSNAIDTAILDDAIRRLGWLHSWRTWWGVKRELRDRFEMPDNLPEILAAAVNSPPTVQLKPNAAATTPK